MEKQIRKFKQPFSFDWTYGVELKKIKEDLAELEKLGVTDIAIEPYDNYGSASVDINAFISRVETDEEYKERTYKVSVREEEIKKRELEQFERLKLKYGQ
jgi:hypothetical protein